MSPANEREHARLAALLRHVMERAEASGAGDHAELQIAWGPGGKDRATIVKGKLRCSADLLVNAESA